MCLPEAVYTLDQQRLGGLGWALWKVGAGLMTALTVDRP